MTQTACVMIRDALDCWRQGGFGGSSIAEPNGPLREALAHGGKEPFGARRSFRPVDRYRPWLSSAERYRARYGFEREPDARRTGEQRLERPLCLHLLPSVVRVQSVRRPRTVRASSRQRPQCRWLGRGSEAGRGALSRQGLAHLFPTPPRHIVTGTG